ncbi:MAG TPA: anhydro-N-acetylmuramic acid kinase [Actinopolymorphaceae bacterium]|nr:anhydro-N-acetylmuramic acid kinase [Actinopolymorphaceae bacterium]
MTRVIGLMSGTSYDGIDVAAADLTLDGDEIVLTPLGALEQPHEDEVRDLIGRVLPPERVEMADVCRLDTLLGQSFAAAAARGIAELADGRADLVVSHGQTVFHWVEWGVVRGTLQLGQPAWIAERTGLPVVSDLRARDITRGGQGAPLVSILDVLLLPPGPVAKAALNLGGIANLTLVRPDGTALAYDLGPANALIDLACRRYFDEPYDVDGRHAAAGRLHAGLLAALLAEPYYDRPAPKSTGKELFHPGYLDAHLSAFPDLAPDDVIATLTDLTATVVERECRTHRIGELIVSGGGVRNPSLMRRLSERLGGPGPQAETVVRPIDDHGLPADAKEAYAFALLGFLTWHGLPATVPACTGAREAALLGSLTPGAGPLTLPPPSAAAPTRLRIRPAGARGSTHDGNDDRDHRVGDRAT